MTAEWTWLTINWFSLLQTVSIVTGLVVVAKQQRDNNRKLARELAEREASSLSKIHDVNRQLVTMGFSNPEFFDILDDIKANPRLERYYLQLWINQFSQIFEYYQRMMIQGELNDSFDLELEDFITMTNARRHWEQFGKFYPASFRKHVNDILQKGEPPEAAHGDTQ